MYGKTRTTLRSVGWRMSQCATGDAGSVSSLRRGQIGCSWCAQAAHIVGVYASREREVLLLMPAASVYVCALVLGLCQTTTAIGGFVPQIVGVCGKIARNGGAVLQMSMLTAGGSAFISFVRCDTG